VETVFTLLLLALILTLAPKKPATLFKDASTLLNMTSKLLDNKINATPTLAIACLEILSRLQFFVMTTMHVPSILVMQHLDVFTLLLLAKESTNVSHLLAIKQPDNVLLNKFNVMMEINAQLMLVMVTPELALTLLLIVMITMHVPPTLAI